MKMAMNGVEGPSTTCNTHGTSTVLGDNKELEESAAEMVSVQSLN